MNLIEQRIWDFLDGIGTDDERKLTGQLIENDFEYRKVYENLKSFNKLVSTVELEEPSMSFTRNLIDKINLEPNPGTIRSLIDKRIVYGITAFFLITIFALLGFLFYQVDWSQNSGFGTLEYKSLVIDTSKFQNNTLINIFFFSDIIIGLYFLDVFFRNRLSSKNSVENFFENSEE